MTRPYHCYGCGGNDVRRHCPGRNCTWVRCGQCGAVSARVMRSAEWPAGRPQVISGVPP